MFSDFPTISSVQEEGTEIFETKQGQELIYCFLATTANCGEKRSFFRDFWIYHHELVVISYASWSQRQGVLSSWSQSNVQSDIHRGSQI